MALCKELAVLDTRRLQACGPTRTRGTLAARASRYGPPFRLSLEELHCVGRKDNLDDL